LAWRREVVRGVLERTRAVLDVQLLIEFSELPHDGLMVPVDADDHAEQPRRSPAAAVRQPRGTTSGPALK